MTFDYWLLTIDFWLLTFDVWLLTFHFWVWLLTFDIWLLALSFDFWHLTFYVWSTITGQIHHRFCQNFHKTPHFEQPRKCNTDVLWYGVLFDGLRLQINHMWYIFRVKHILIIHIFFVWNSCTSESSNLSLVVLILILINTN